MGEDINDISELMVDFYKSIEDITLFPGTLAELNEFEQAYGRKRVYEIMPLDGKPKITSFVGVIIPPLAQKQPEPEKQELAPDGLFGGFAEFASKVNKLGLAKLAYSGADIRSAAKKAGANGVIHVRYFGKNESGSQQYIGVPVRVKGTRSLEESVR